MVQPLGSFQIGADGALLLPTRSFLLPPQPPVPALQSNPGAGISPRFPLDDDPLAQGLCRAHPHPAPHKPLQFYLHPTSSMTHLSQGKSLFISSENAWQWDLPVRSPHVTRGAGRVVAWHLPKGSGHREQLLLPTQLFPGDFCHFCI